jgi:hypothetical protein
MIKKGKIDNVQPEQELNNEPTADVPTSSPSSTKPLVSGSGFQVLDNYYKGMPCMMGEAVGKIIGESEKGSWGVINGIEMFSVPFFATPHGTIIKVGVLKLSKITEEGLIKLSEYEQQVIDKGDDLYGGRLA